MAGLGELARLTDRDTLRAAVLTVRGDIKEFAPPEDPDPALVELADRPFESVTDAAERLTRLESALREQRDRRAVFLTIYSRMTRAVHDGIDRGGFSDPAWMRRYLLAFANYYRRAFLAFERGTIDEVPDPWRVAFGSALRGDSLVMQDAFLGVNAHINFDLALTLRDVGIDPHRAEKYGDHRAIDDILSHLVDVQQDVLAEVYAAGIGNVDAAFGQVDEAFTLRSMTKGREQAWRIAVVLTDLGVPPVPSYARWVLRTTATGAAFFILAPALDPSVTRALREVERETLDLQGFLARVEDRMDAELRA